MSSQSGGIKTRAGGGVGAFQDKDGRLAGRVAGCSSGLLPCLSSASLPPERKDIVKNLGKETGSGWCDRSGEENKRRRAREMKEPGDPRVT